MVKIKSKIKKGDEIIVIAGKDKGNRGTVLRMRRLKDGRVKVLAGGVSMIKKHVKPNPQANEPGGIKEIESFIDISNVMIFNPVTKKGDKVGYRFLEDGQKVRSFKSSGEVIGSDKE